MEVTDHEKQAAQRAVLKQNANKKPTATELKALEAVRLAQAFEVFSKSECPRLKTRFLEAVETLILEKLQAVRPKFFNLLFRVQNKQRGDLANRFGFGCGPGNSTINVVEILVAMREILSKNADVLGAGSDGESETLAAAKLEKLNRESQGLAKKNRILEIKIEDLESKLIDRETLDEILSLTSGVFRSASLKLQKKGYDKAYEIIADAVAMADKHVERLLDDNDDDSTN